MVGEVVCGVFGILVGIGGIDVVFCIFLVGVLIVLDLVVEIFGDIGIFGLGVVGVLRLLEVELLMVYGFG